VSAHTAAADGVVVFGIDCASRALRSIEPLPQCAAVATGDDLEAVTRIVKLLTGEIDRRRHVLASAQAESLTAWNRNAAHDRLPRVLLLVDGYANLSAVFNAPSPHEGASAPNWLEMLHRIVVDGRQVGVHTVITADRRAAVPGVLMSSIANRLVLRQSDATGYADLGVPSTAVPASEPGPGRGLLGTRALVQVACVSADGDGAAQADALAQLATATTATIPDALVTAPLDERVPALDVDVPFMHVALGRADVTRQPVVVDLAQASMLVAGPPRSGRSTTLHTIAAQLAAGGAEVWVVGTERSSLRTFDKATQLACGSNAEVLRVVDELQRALAAPPAESGEIARVLVVDDLDFLDDPAFQPAFQTFARARRMTIVASVETRSLVGYTADPLLNEMRKARRMLVLQPDSALDVQASTGVRVPLRPGLRMPSGRGALIVDRAATIVQVAFPEPAA
jgi:S-DNA-T family DNA segregation ATPase FtsK/SpoIIIE